MSMEYWPIMGYGVQVTKDIFDPAKVERILGIVNDGEDDLLLDDVLEAICSLPEARGLTWACTAEMWYDPIWYLYCPALLPWVARLEAWQGKTQEGVKETIRNLLAPILRDNLDPSELKFGEIADVGCG